MIPFSFAQSGGRITGTVIDSTTGKPLPGVNVGIGSISKGAATNTDGHYEIDNIPEGTYQISASFIGYGTKTKTLKVTDGGIQEVNFTLTSATQRLDQVVVTGYGTSKESTFTGSASVVSGEEINTVKTSNVSQSLQGVLPGVVVRNTSGQPGSNASITIRGISSLTASTSPLIVLDGAPYSGGLSTLNPNDIGSVTVLKDAAATALYGSRAANGVVVITTKKGLTSKPVINFNTNVGFSKLAVPYSSKLPPKKLFKVGWEALRNGQLDRGADSTTASEWASKNLVSRYFQNPQQNVFNSAEPIGLDGKLKPDVKQLFKGNWYDAIFKTRPKQSYSLGISGATGKQNQTQYYISGSYMQDKGYVITQDFKRITSNVKLSSQLNKWLKIGANLDYTHGFTQNPYNGIRFVRDMPSVYPVWEWDYAKNAYATDAEGHRIPDFGWNNRTEWRGWNVLYTGNAKNSRSIDFNSNKNDNLATRSFIQIDFLPSLSLKTTLATNLSYSYYLSYSSPLLGNGRADHGDASRSSDRSFVYTLKNILTYDHSFKKHNIKILAGQEIYNTKYNYFSGSKKNFPITGLFELGAASTTTGVSSSEDNYHLMSYLSQFKYDFNNRYFLSGSFRADGSSKFAPQSRWGKFWSVGGAWLLSDEKFISDVLWINKLKLHSSHGSTGNDNVGYYNYQGLYATGYNDLNNPGVLLSSLPTPNLIWESNIQTDVGLDFTFIDNVLSGSIDFYNRKSKNLILYTPLPPSTGIGGINKNIGAVRNRGYEVSLTGRIYNHKNFIWTVDANISHYVNKIISLPQKEINRGYQKWTVGVPMFDYFIPVWAGVDPKTGRNTWWKFTYKTDKEGDPIFDKKGNKIVEKRERTDTYSDVDSPEQSRYVGSSLPKYTGSITNSFKYKGLDLSFMFYYSLGGKMYDGDYMENVVWRDGFNLNKKILERWTPQHRHTSIPRVTSYNISSLTAASSEWLFNNNYIRLRNITLGYSFPITLLESTGIDKLRLYFTGTNLLTWGPAVKRGTDPEINHNGYVANGANDNGSGPIYKTYSFGLQVTF
jgi:TonB-linked SusC/RagA family outer membrane protein